jgi:ribosomal protein S18 acetylase RimI-like enzyme
MKNIGIKIKNAEVQDIPAILRLMEEFAKFVNLSEYLEVTEAKLTAVMSGDDALLKGLIAFDDQTPVAYAFFYQTFASFRGQKSVYLEDIFIASAYRKSGIGERMLREIARTGKRSGAARMDLEVLEWNQPAVNFYKKHGALADEQARHFKFTDEAFQKLAE